MNSKHRSQLALWLFNPFQRIAGWPSLLFGVTAIVIASIIGAQKNVHFDGVLDTHVGPPFPVWFFIGEGIINWISLTAILWMAGKAVSQTSFRAVDLFGTQAFARWPTILIATSALLPGFHRFTDQLVRALQVNPTAPQVTFASSDALMFLAVTVSMLIGLVWMVALMWKSFSLCCNVRGPKAIVAFVVSLIAAEVLSKVLIMQLPNFL